MALCVLTKLKMAMTSKAPIVVTANGSRSNGIVSTFSETVRRWRRKGHCSEQHFCKQNYCFSNMDNTDRQEEIFLNLKYFFSAEERQESLLNSAASRGLMPSHN